MACVEGTLTDAVNGVVYNSLSSPRRRRCFMVRVGLAARAGHHGAQLAAYGEDCIGAVIEVYWPLDERCYRGRIVWFNPFTVQHVGEGRLL